MVLALLLSIKNNCSLFRVAEQKLNPNSMATGFLLAGWLYLLLSGFRLAHHWLSGRFDLSAVRCDMRTSIEHLKAELQLYFRALLPGISSKHAAGIEVVVMAYAEDCKHFMFGVPSQDRIRRFSP